MLTGQPPWRMGQIRAEDSLTPDMAQLQFEWGRFYFAARSIKHRQCARLEKAQEENQGLANLWVFRSGLNQRIAGSKCGKVIPLDNAV